MATKAPEAIAPEEKKVSAEAIGKLVLRTLGKPPHFVRIKAAELWGNRFRITIYVDASEGKAIAPAERISDSFFIITDEDGDITESRPTITRKY